MEIIPAIIPKNIEDLHEECAKVAGSVDAVQIDICDGVFVSSKSWPYREDSIEYTEDFKAIVAERAEFPFWDSLNFEVHLMVAHPEKVINDWISAGASRIIVHAETLQNPKQFFADFRERFPKSGGSLLSVELGVALCLETPVDRLASFINDVDFVQLMSIAKIGGHGQAFDTSTFGRLDVLRTEYPGTIVSIDGGVTLDNAGELLKVGANRLVAGSAIFSVENPIEIIESFKALI
jgi:ribulose-phosphate 3-epimerase